MELQSRTLRQLSLPVMFTAVLAWVALMAQPAWSDDRVDIANVLDKYLKALYARDFRAAYEQISSADQRLKDVHNYSRERGEFRDFILEAARAVAQSIDVSLVELRVDQERATAKVKANVPDALKLNSLMLDWDSDRMESLTIGERKTLLGNIDRQIRENSLAMVAGEENFNLVKEDGGWKIFLNWATGIKLTFQSSIPPSSPVDIKIEQTEVASRPGQVFRVAMKIKNTGKQVLSTRIGHLVEPQEMRDYLDLVDCGFILPVRLQPGKEEEFVTTYLLRGTLPETVRRISVTYAVTSTPFESVKP
jgi:cytochrome c oxidase assembly protein CtaG/Cox11